MSSESEILHQVRVANFHGSRLMRNNVGLLIDAYGQRVRYGLGSGSPDLVGWLPRIVTPELLGERIAQFLAVEVKASPRHRPSREQAKWLEACRAAGGLAGVVSSVEELESLILQGND